MTRAQKRFWNRPAVAYGVAAVLASSAIGLTASDEFSRSRTMLLAARDAAAAQTDAMLLNHAGLGRLVATALPGLAGTPSETSAPTRLLPGDLVQGFPGVWEIVITDAAGKTLFATRRDSQRSPDFSERGITTLSASPPPTDRHSPVLVRSRDPSLGADVVGVQQDVLGHGDAVKARVVVFTKATDLPAADAGFGRTWLLTHDGTVIAEAKGAADVQTAAALSDGWRTLRSSGGEGIGTVAMPDGDHRVVFRWLRSWPVVLLVDTGLDGPGALASGEGLALLLMAGAGVVAMSARERGGRAAPDVSVEDRVAAGPERTQREDSFGLAQRLAAGIAHEVNNVLTVLSFDAEMVAAVEPGHTELALLSRSMQAATARGSALTHNLLAYAERAVLRPKRVDLAEELRKRRDSLAAQLGAGQTLVCIGLDGVDPGPVVMVDPDALGICLAALLRNAAQSEAAEGEIRLTLGCATGQSGPAAQLTVEDSGPGMDHHVVQQAMEPGFSGWQHGRHLGLGLAAASGFARQSGGKLALDSRLGLGTRVTLSLPLEPLCARPPEGAPGLPAPPEVKTPPTGPRRAIRVLLVDDSAPVRDSIARRLRADGYDVVEAPTAADAEALVATGFDLMITDIVLNEAVDGWTLATQARLLDPVLPLVFMSGFMTSRQPELLAGDELASFVRKPVNGAELQTVIAGLLALRETRLIRQGRTAALSRKAG